MSVAAAIFVRKRGVITERFGIILLLSFWFTQSYQIVGLRFLFEEFSVHPRVSLLYFRCACC